MIVTLYGLEGWGLGFSVQGLGALKEAVQVSRVPERGSRAHKV